MGTSNIPRSVQPAVTSYAEINGISMPHAWEELQLESKLSVFAVQERSQDGYAGFMLERTAAGPVGVLATVAAVSQPPIPHRRDDRVALTPERQRGGLADARRHPDQDDCHALPPGLPRA